MKLTRKPLAVVVSVFVFGLPMDFVWGDSSADYSLGYGAKHGGGGGSSRINLRNKIAVDTADVIRDAELIKRNTAQLKQRVRLLELQLTTILRKYQADISAIDHVKTYPVKNSKSEHRDSVRTMSYLSPVYLALPSTQNTFDLTLVQPELEISEEESTIEPQAVAVALLKKVDAGVDEAARSERSASVVDDNKAALDEIVEPSIVGEALAMNDATLSEMRGGFTTTSGLQVAFGIERAVYVNGALVSTTSLNVLNLGNLTPVVPTAAALVANVNVPTAADLAANVNVPTAAGIAANVHVPTAAELSVPVIAALPQSNTAAPVSGAALPISSVSPSAASASAAPASTAVPVASSAPVSAAPVASAVASGSTSAGVPAASVVPASSDVTSSVQVPSVVTTPGSVALIQTGVGNVVVPGAFSASSAGTVIQNTLNDQKIQNITVVNATVNSMQILKALNLQAAISSAINDSVRK